MAISVQQFCAAYPALYHMAEVKSWLSISRHGLLSTTALLDLLDVAGKQRILLESTRRPDSVALRHPQYGSAVLRDQKPLSPPAVPSQAQFRLLPIERLRNRGSIAWNDASRSRTIWAIPVPRVPDAAGRQFVSVSARRL